MKFDIKLVLQNTSVAATYVLYFLQSCLLVPFLYNFINGSFILVRGFSMIPSKWWVCKFNGSFIWWDDQIKLDIYMPLVMKKSNEKSTYTRYILSLLVMIIKQKLSNANFF
jgi:fructose-1,6-bisphosphatase